MIGATHGGDVHVTLAPQHSLWAPSGAAGADHHEVVRGRRRRSGIAHGDRGVVVDGARQQRSVAAIVDRDQQVGDRRCDGLGDNRSEAAVIADGAGSHVVQEVGDFGGGVVVVDVHRNRAGLGGGDERLGIAVVAHQQRHPVLTTLPARSVLVACVGAQSPTGQEVGQPRAGLCRRTERRDPGTAAGHHPLGNGLGDGVEDRGERPFGHGVPFR